MKSGTLNGEASEGLVEELSERAYTIWTMALLELLI